MGDPARDATIALLRDLRRAGLEAHMEYEGRSLKSQMKRADRLKAAYALILGEDELARGVITVKDMRASEQTQVGRAAILEYCQARASGGQE
jgi:histidyl-tRNA synthetase